MSLHRSRLRLGLLGAVLALILLATACGDDAGDAASVAGGATLTEADVVALVDQPDAAVLDKVEAAGAISDWVRNELFYAELAENGFTDVQSYLDTARSQFAEFLAANPDADVPPIDSPAGLELIRSVALGPILSDYLTEVEGVEPEWPVRLCSSHILVETEAEAQEVIARLDAGEDFAALATELSLDTGSGLAGGDLGCVDPASFVAEFVAGAAALGGPGITPPVESQFGWHVIDVRSFEATPSEDPAEIQNAVLQTPEFADLQERVVARDVTIDPRFGTWDPLSASVVTSGG